AGTLPRGGVMRVLDMPHARAWALRPRRRGALAALVVIALLPVLVLAGTPQPAWADGEPTVTVGNDLLTAGDQVQVSGTGWQDGELLQVNICAQPDRTGAMQCAEGGVSNVQVMW